MSGLPRLQEQMVRNFLLTTLLIINRLNNMVATPLVNGRGPSH